MGLQPPTHSIPHLPVIVFTTSCFLVCFFTFFSSSVHKHLKPFTYSPSAHAAVNLFRFFLQLCMLPASSITSQRPPQSYCRVIDQFADGRAGLARSPGFAPCLTLSPTYFHRFNSGMLILFQQISKLVAEFVFSFHFLSFKFKLLKLLISYLTVFSYLLGMYIHTY